MNSSAASIASILRAARTIAVVGLSPNPQRASHEVAAYLQVHGYRIIPVNPVCAGSTLLGEYCYASLTMAGKAMREQGLKIDLVDCFRKSDAIEPIVDEAIAIAAGALWMQLGVINHPAAEKAQAAGLHVVMDRCIKIDHANLVTSVSGRFPPS